MDNGHNDPGSDTRGHGRRTLRADETEVSDEVGGELAGEIVDDAEGHARRRTVRGPGSADETVEGHRLPKR